MAEIYKKQGEDIERSIKRFKKLIDREGILLEVKKRRYFAKPSLEKHEKSKKKPPRLNHFNDTNYYFFCPKVNV